MNQTLQELITQLKESHERFVEALLEGNGELAMLAYANYVRGLALVLTRVKPGYLG
jgi:hypothetical protein